MVIRATSDKPSPRPSVLAGELLAHPPRQKRSRRARAAILAAALSRFGETGYDTTTIEQISNDAAVAVGGFYKHFRSKRQVLLVLVDRLLRELDAAPPTTPGEDVPAIIERIRSRFSDDCAYGGVCRAWHEATLRDAALAQLHEQIEAWTTERFAAALSAAAATAGTRANVDIPALSRMLSFIFWRLHEDKTSDRDALSHTVVTVVKHALFEDAAARQANPG